MERKYFVRVSGENACIDRIHGSSVIAVAADTRGQVGPTSTSRAVGGSKPGIALCEDLARTRLTFSSSSTISWYSVVLRPSFCVLVIPGRAVDLAAYLSFLPLGLRVGHRRPRPLEAVQFSLHQLTDR